MGADFDRSQANEFHRLAKDAGNRLKGYVLTYSSSATAVFFLSLAGRDGAMFSRFEKFTLIASLMAFVLTVVICLVELKIDARRFFNVAKQLELPRLERDWTKNDAMKSGRRRLIFVSYWTMGTATLFAVAFLTSRIA